MLRVGAGDSAVGEDLLYKAGRTAATHRLGIDLHRGGGYAVSDQRVGDGLCTGEAEPECGSLGVRVGIGGVAIAGHGDQGAAAAPCQCAQRRGGGRRQVGDTVAEHDCDGVAGADRLTGGGGAGHGH